MPHKDPEVLKAYKRKYYADRRDEKRAERAAHVAANREVINARWRERYHESYHLREKARKYNLTREEVAALRAAQPTCRICPRPSAHVDHNHVTGQVRGMLCKQCNMGLGQFRDSPELLEAAAAYLRAADFAAVAGKAA